MPSKEKPRPFGEAKGRMIAPHERQPTVVRCYHPSLGFPKWPGLFFNTRAALPPRPTPPPCVLAPSRYYTAFSYPSAIPALQRSQFRTGDGKFPRIRYGREALTYFDSSLPLGAGSFSQAPQHSPSMPGMLAMPPQLPRMRRLGPWSRKPMAMPRTASRMMTKLMMKISMVGNGLSLDGVEMSPGQRGPCLLERSRFFQMVMMGSARLRT